MKKWPEIYVGKKYISATIIPALMFACVVVSAVLSQQTYRGSSVARALEPTDLLNHKKAEQNYTTADLDRIHDRHGIENDLHQQKQQPVTSVPAETTKAEFPDSALLLIGAFSGAPADAMAIIKDLESDSVGIYKTGQQIGNGHIESIEKNKVVVFGEGHRFILTPMFGQSQNARVHEADGPATVQKSRSIPIGSGPFLEAYEDYQTPVASLVSVLSCAKLESFSLNGQLQGLRISGLDDILVANKMDIRNGDVIHTVNGHLLMNKQQAWQVLKKAKAQDTIDVEVLYGD